MAKMVERTQTLFIWTKFIAANAESDDAYTQSLLSIVRAEIAEAIDAQARKDHRYATEAARHNALKGAEAYLANRNITISLPMPEGM